MLTNFAKIVIQVLTCGENIFSMVSTLDCNADSQGSNQRLLDIFGDARGAAVDAFLKGQTQKIFDQGFFIKLSHYSSECISGRMLKFFNKSFIFKGIRRVW